MRSMLGAMLTLAFLATAAAQTGGNGAAGGGAAAAAGATEPTTTGQGGGPPPAPIGHVQPRPSDFPPGYLDHETQRTSAQKALDDKLWICRGC